MKAGARRDAPRSRKADPPKGRDGSYVAGVVRAEMRQKQKLIKDRQADIRLDGQPSIGEKSTREVALGKP